MGLVYHDGLLFVLQFVVCEVLLYWLPTLVLEDQ